MSNTYSTYIVLDCIDSKLYVDKLPLLLTYLLTSFLTYLLTFLLKVDDCGLENCGSLTRGIINDLCELTVTCNVSGDYWQ